MRPLIWAQSQPQTRVHRLAPGDTLFASGDTAHSVFVVEQGFIEVFADASDLLASGNEQGLRVGMRGPNDILGESEFLARKPSIAHGPRRAGAAVALIQAVVLEVPYQAIDAAPGAESAAWLSALGVTAAEQANKLGDLAAEARLCSQEVRLARLLLDFVRTTGSQRRQGNVVRYPLRLRVQDVAARLDMARETATRILKRWQEEGIVLSARGVGLMITDRARLELLAARRRRPNGDNHANASTEVTDALAQGEHWRALRLVRTALSAFPHSPELQYLACLAAARAGALSEALRLLESFDFAREIDGLRPLVAERLTALSEAIDLDLDLDQAATAAHGWRLEALVEDIAALRARILKDRAFAADPLATQRHQLACAAEAYAAVFRFTDRPFSGVNAASLARLGGDHATARELARQVLKRVAAEARDYWSAATLAEAHAVLDDQAAALQAWRRGLAAADATPAAIATTRRQLRRLADCGMAAARQLLNVAAAGDVIVYSGHMMRAATLDAAAQRQHEDTVTPLIDAALACAGATIGYGALACGADIIIAERLLARDAQLHVVLPFGFSAFLQASVDPGETKGQRSWRERFDACLARAQSITFCAIGSPPQADHDELFHLAFRRAAGQAILRAQGLVSEARLLVIHDGAGPGSIAGSGSHLAQWQALNRPVSAIECPWRRGGATTPQRSERLGWSVIVRAADQDRAAALHARHPEALALPKVVEGVSLLAILETSPGAALKLAATLRNDLAAAESPLVAVLDYGLVRERDGTPSARRFDGLVGPSVAENNRDHTVWVTEAFMAAALTEPSDPLDAQVRDIAEAIGPCGIDRIYRVDAAGG